MRRQRGTALALAVLLLGLWYPVSAGLLEWPRPPADGWLLAGGFVSAAYALFAWIGPRLAYVQAGRDHLRVQTPIFRMNVSYRRVQGTRPLDFARTFPPQGLTRGVRKVAEPFYGSTAVGVNLNGFPLAPGILRLFLHPLFFAPDMPGFVLAVPQWMALSSEISARLDAWRADQHQGQRRGRHSPGASEILDDE
jgi:hypothetical protein